MAKENSAISFKFLKRKSFFIIGVMALVGVLACGLAYRFFSDKPLFEATVINKHVTDIVKALSAIDQQCNIISIKGPRASIDFLTVGSFASSEVGPLALAYPKKWEGPYMLDNPTCQGALYEIVAVGGEYYIVPGDKVRLPNGKVMGLDIKLVETTNMAELLAGDLTHKNVQLAQKCPFKVGDWDYPAKSGKMLKKIERAVKEMGEALPFTLNQDSLNSELQNQVH
jgi:hypothetical protein